MASIRKRTRADGSIGYTVLYKIQDPETGKERQGGLTWGVRESAEAFRAAVEVHGAARALDMFGVDRVRRRVSKPAGITVAEWIRRHIDQLTGVEQTTLDSYERYLKLDIAPTIGDIPLTELTEEDIAAWVKRMETEPSAKTGRVVKPKTIHNKHGFLSGALSAAVPKYIPANPAAGRSLPRQTGDLDDDDDGAEMRMLSRDEFAALLAATTEHWRPFLEFLVTSGCRWGEATALKPGDVNRSQGTVRIRRAWKKSSKGHHIGPPKTKRSRRTINVPKSVLDKLDYSGEWLFTGRDGPNWRQAGTQPVRYQGFRRRVWDRAVTKAKLDPKPTPHDLRHTCASWALNDGVPITTVSRHLGHESIKITADIYADVDRASHQAMADVMGKLIT